MVEHARDVWPHHWLVPSEPFANMEFRQKIAEVGGRGRTEAVAIRRMCREDPLFFINAFCWTFNPMWHPDHPEQPFITYPAQDRLVRELYSTLRSSPDKFRIRDRTILKSRETGVSWLVLLILLQRWLFFKGQTFLLISRNEGLVDDAKNLDALMPKLDFVLERVPPWMRPTMGIGDRSNLRMHNPITGSIFNGTSTTGDIGRGGRRTVLVPDEFAFFDRRDSYRALKATQGAALCRWFLSTPNGVGNAFYDVVHDTGIPVLTIGWEDIPFKAAGRYRSTDGKLEIVDKDYDFGDEYPFVLDGKDRSPWWDAEERRTPIASLMAQEHGRSFLGSGDPFFSAKEREKIARTVRPPFWRGTISTDGRLVSKDNGLLDFWISITGDDEHFAPRDRKYVIGADVSTGSGASNSCLEVFDCRTNEKVAEYADPHADPPQLANVAARLGHLFCDWTGDPAQVIFESNGPGYNFGKQLEREGYPNMFHADRGEGDRRGQPGLHVNPQVKQNLLREYAVSIGRGDLIERSQAALDEHKDFQYIEGGQIAHIKSVSGEDHSGARMNHGDRVTGNALANHARRRIGEPYPMAGSTEPNYPCFYNDIVQAKRDSRELASVNEGWLHG